MLSGASSSKRRAAGVHLYRFSVVCDANGNSHDLSLLVQKRDRVNTYNYYGSLKSVVTWIFNSQTIKTESGPDDGVIILQRFGFRVFFFFCFLLLYYYD